MDDRKWGNVGVASCGFILMSFQREYEKQINATDVNKALVSSYTPRRGSPVDGGGAKAQDIKICCFFGLVSESKIAKNYREPQLSRREAEAIDRISTPLIYA